MASKELLEGLEKFYKKNYPAGIPKEFMEKINSAIQLQESNKTKFAFLLPSGSKDLDDEFLKSIIEKGLKLQTSNVTISDLEADLNEHDLIVLFGEALNQIVLPEEDPELHQVVKKGEQEYLIAPDLSEIKNNPLQKKAFWDKLKTYV